MEKELNALLQNTKYKTSILANAASYLFTNLNDVNWVGFYLLNDKNLYLGPFQGLPACTDIPYGRGACGKSAQEKNIVIYNDVSLAPNYISCHSETKSEIVLPIILNNVVFAVLDIDSLSLNRFQDKDKNLLEKLANIISNNLQNAY